MHREMGLDMVNNMIEIRANPRPGIVNGLLQMRIDGEPAPELEILGNLGLVIGGGFDTTTALTAHSLEWLSEHPEQRQLLSDERKTLLDPATEEFLRYFTPAPRGRQDLRRRHRTRRHPLQRGRAAVDFVGDGQPGPRGVPRPGRDHPRP